MEHEMRLAVLTLGLEDHAHPMVMPYCVGCGWVGERCFTFAAESISADWRTHVKKFDESEDGESRTVLWCVTHECPQDYEGDCQRSVMEGSWGYACEWKQFELHPVGAGDPQGGEQ